MRNMIKIIVLFYSILFFSPTVPSRLLCDSLPQDNQLVQGNPFKNNDSEQRRKFEEESIIKFKKSSPFSYFIMQCLSPFKTFPFFRLIYHAINKCFNDFIDKRVQVKLLQQQREEEQELLKQKKLLNQEETPGGPGGGSENQQEQQCGGGSGGQESDNKKLEDLIAGLRQELEGKKKELNKLRGLSVELENKINEVNGELSAENAKNELIKNSFKEKNSELQKRILDVERKIQEKILIIAELEKKTTYLKNNNNQLVEAIKNFENNKNVLNQDIANVGGSIQVLTQEVASIEQSSKEQQAKVVEARKKLECLNDVIVGVDTTLSQFSLLFLK